MMVRVSSLDRLTVETIIRAGWTASLTGGVLTALVFVTATVADPYGGGWAVALPSAPLVFLIAWPVWVVGLIVLGAPCWLVLHRWTRRSVPLGALAGAGLTFAVAGGYGVLSEALGAPAAWAFIGGLTATGALSGALLVRTAYPQGGGR